MSTTAVGQKDPFSQAKNEVFNTYSNAWKASSSAMVYQAPYANSLIMPCVQKMQDHISEMETVSELRAGLKNHLFTFGMLCKDTRLEEEKSALVAAMDKITSVLKKFQEPDPFPTSAKTKLSKTRIKEHNEKAQDALEILEDPDEVFMNFKNMRSQKKELDATRMHVESVDKFKPYNPKQTHSYTTTLSSCSVSVACTIGQRENMEDRFLITSFTFLANGQPRTLEIEGVFDGHGGKEAVEFISTHFESELKAQLEKCTTPGSPSEDDIFNSLKTTFNLLHYQFLSTLPKDEQELRKKKLSGSGTTAIIGLKLSDSNELYVANVGDSRGYLNRNGMVIPMSIEQKPFFFSGQSLYPNEYADQLFKKGVQIAKSTEGEINELRDPKKMLLSFHHVGEGICSMLLGIKGEHLDMARSVGGVRYDTWKKHTPEIFKQTVQPGDQLIFHTDGVTAGMYSVVKAVEEDKKGGHSSEDTAICLVESSIASGDNITAMVVTFK